ncbi:hypothetical protein OC835_003209 [Tilletia horrida]|nr:hypothetical protein OC835_003209 [Tilletia horrida]
MASDFSSALSVWRDLALPRVQDELAAEVEPIVDAQRSALLARKSLAERTREFRALAEDDADAAKTKLAALKPLLKAYQAEIDSLSKRAKNAENGLLQLHSTLAPAPDPYPLLEVVLDQTASLTELDSLKASNSRLHRDLQSLQLASENTQTALTDRIRHLEAQLDSRVADAIHATEKELTAKHDERLRNAAEREDSLQQSLNVAQEQIKELRTTLAAATPSEADASAAEATQKANAAKLAQLDIITADLDRAQGRIATLERRNEELRAEVESLRSGREAEDRIAELTSSLADARTQAESLREALSLERTRAEHAEHEHTRRVDELARKSETAQRENAGLRERLAKLADYDEIKRELSIFRSVEFAQYEDADVGISPAGGAADDAPAGPQNAEAPGGAAAQAETKTFESMLVQKNKRLQDELTSERVAHNELKASHTTLASDLTSARAEVDRLKALTERLENDLLQLNIPTLTNGGAGKVSQTNGSASAATTAAAAVGGSEATSRAAPDPFEALDALTAPSSSSSSFSSSNPAVPPTPHSAKATQPPSSSSSSSSSQPPPSSSQPPPSASGSTSAESSLLPIITSQRDRFRARNAELEEELRTQFNTISELRAEVKQLQADNLALYEKVRYLQSYAAGAGEGSAGAKAVGYPPVGSAAGMAGYAQAQQQPRIVVDRSVGRGGPGEERYRDRYEEHMDPFASFRGREQSRAFAALNPLERLLHMITRVVLGNRRMRIAFTAYALGLHVLVLLILFEYEFGGRRWTRTSSIGVTPASPPQ